MRRIFVLMALLSAMVLAGCHNNPKTPANNEEVKEATTPEALFNTLAEGIYAKQDPQESIKMVDRLVTDYPDYENNPVALFMLASYVYDEQLGDFDKARETYQRIIDEYPGTPFANDAAIAITQLGIPLEDLVKMFEEQGQE